MITADAGERWVLVHDEPNERVRRYPVPGGWLYQVERAETVDSADCVGWHDPVFVPEPRPVVVTVRSREDGET